MKERKLYNELSKRYSKEIKEADEWLEKDVKTIKSKDLPKRASKYIKNVIGLITGAEEVLEGKFKDPLNIDTFQMLLFTTHYHIALINSEVQKILNKIKPKSNSEYLMEVCKNLVEEKQDKWFEQGFKPKYNPKFKSKHY